MQSMYKAISVGYFSFAFIFYAHVAWDTALISKKKKKIATTDSILEAWLKQV